MYLLEKYFNNILKYAPIIFQQIYFITCCKINQEVINEPAEINFAKTFIAYKYESICKLLFSTSHAMEITKLNQMNSFYSQAIWITLIVLAIYISFTVVIYPYYLGPLKNLPRPNNPIKSLYEVYTERFKGNAEHLLQLSLKHGPVVHLYGNVVLLNDQSFKKYWNSYKFKKSSFYSLFDIGGRANLFSAIEREYHSKVRKLVSPAFSIKTLENVEKTVYEVGSQGLVNHIRTNINNEMAEVFDMFQLFHCLTFDVISQLVFGTNFNTIFDEQNALCYVKIIKDTLKAIFMRTMIPLYSWLPLPMEKEFKKIIIDNIKLRENNPCPDILQSLIDSEDPETGARLNNDEIAAECMSLLFAGMDTTANTLTWTLYELLRNPSIYELVENEILNEFPNFNEPISVEKAKSSLKYLDAVLLESMRLYPVASGGMPRIVPEGGITVSGYYLPEKVTNFYNKDDPY